MPTFEYSALDSRGQPTDGLIAAAGRAEAISALARREVFVTAIAPSDADQAPGAPGLLDRLRWRRRVAPKAKAAMLGQLAMALQAGLPLLQALRVVQKQAPGQRLGRLVEALGDSVEAGRSLSQAMGDLPREFTPLEASMVRVGETAGVLDEVMGYLAEFAERDVEVRQQVRTAATYPLFVLSLAMVSVVVVVTVILPQVIATITDNIGASALPAPTRILMSLSAAMRSYGWLMALGAVGAVWLFRAWLARPAGRLAFDAFKLRVPVLGTAIRRVAVARFARTLGTLCKAGIQILEALRVLRDTLGNEALARQIDKVADGVTQGQSIAEPLGRTGQFPPLLIQVIAMGEKTGKLDELLLRTSRAYEKETAAAVNRVLTILPAILIVLLALVVGFILMAVLLPIIGMETSVPGM